MQTPHTPGPWAVIGTEVRWLADDETVTTITELEDLTPRQAANARLIAAAPDLLDALRAARYMVWHMTGDDAICAPWNALLPHIDAAIARATGQ